jgi:hypothetical protein
MPEGIAATPALANAAHPSRIHASAATRPSRKVIQSEAILLSLLGLCDLSQCRHVALDAARSATHRTELFKSSQRLVDL